MKKRLKIWSLRLIATISLIFGLLVIIVFNPSFSYAHQTTFKNFTVHHSTGLNKHLLLRLDETTELLKTSEFFNPELKFQVCLNDGSIYPTLLRTLRSPAFAWGFHTKIVLQGNADYQNNTVELNGYTWNLTQLLAHEAVHCLQFDKLGLLKSNPVAGIPEWKWEGYAEYISRQGADQKNLINNIALLQATEKIKNNNWITFDDKSGTVIAYYRSWLLVQYCIEVKKLSYSEILDHSIKNVEVEEEMWAWYKHQPNVQMN